MILTRFSTYVFLTGIALSIIAAYYSIVGLTTIFAAAVIPIIIMGSALELGKVVATIWLKVNWDRSPFLLKLYLIPAVLILMLITSMGVFGFLAKSHSEQSLKISENIAAIEIFDSAIDTEREKIEANRTVLQQLDNAINQIIERSTDERGAARALQLRNRQSSERTNAQESIRISQEKIAQLTAEKTPLTSSVRQLEAEVGPIAYIAAMIYGDSADKNVLEQAVRWVIILLVIVFDPLAIVLIIAAQQSHRWENENQIPLVEKVVEKDDEIKLENYKWPEPFIWKHSHHHSTKNAVEKNVVSFSDAKIDCPQCGDVQVAVPGFGSVCPNKNCGVTPVMLSIDSESEGENDVSFSQYKKQPPVKIINYLINDVLESPVTEKNDVVISTPPLHVHGVTVPKKLYSAKDAYVTYEGKRMSIQNLKSIRPDLVMNDDGTVPNQVLFGDTFPLSASIGDTYIRVDKAPHAVYTYENRAWNLRDKEEYSGYLTDEYIKYLITSISTNGYSPDLLTDTERSTIIKMLSEKNK
jgi:hypothetical protein